MPRIGPEDTPDPVEDNGDIDTDDSDTDKSDTNDDELTSGGGTTIPAEETDDDARVSPGGKTVGPPSDGVKKDSGTVDDAEPEDSGGGKTVSPPSDGSDSDTDTGGDTGGANKRTEPVDKVEPDDGTDNGGTQPEKPTSPPPEPKQGIESTADFAGDQFEPDEDDPGSVREQATRFESKIVSENENLDREDVRIVEQDGTLQAELTRTGKEATTAAALGLSQQDIAITEEDEVVPTSETGEAELDIQSIEQGVQEEYPDARSYSIDREGQRYDVEVTTGAGETVSYTVDQDLQTQRTDIGPREPRTTGGVGSASAVATQSNELQDQLAARFNRFTSGERELETQARSDARQQIETQLQEQLGVELSPQEDIKFTSETEDGQTVIRGQLSESGRKTVAEQTQFGGRLEGTPAQDIGRFLGGVRYEYQSRTRDEPDIVGQFEDARPDLSDEAQQVTDRAVQFATNPAEAFLGPEQAQQLDEQTTGGAPVIAPGAGGFKVARGVAGIAALTAGGLATRTALQEETPTAEAEVAIPEDRQVFPESEVPVTSRGQVFQSELSVPDPQSRYVSDLGIPEQGVIIDPSDTGSPADTTRIDIGSGVTETELAIPSERGETQPFTPQTSPQQISRQTGEERPTRRDRQTGARGARESGLPSEFIPDEEVTIGEVDRGSGFIRPNRRRGAVQSGRLPRDDATLTSPEERFLAFGATETPPLLDEAQEPQARLYEQTVPRGGAAEEIGLLSATTAAQTTRTRIAQEPSVDVRAEPAALSDSLADLGVQPDTGTRPATQARTDALADQYAQSDALGQAQQVAQPTATPGQYSYPNAPVEQYANAPQYGYGATTVPASESGDEDEKKPNFVQGDTPGFVIESEDALTDTGIASIEEIKELEMDLDLDDGGL